MTNHSFFNLAECTPMVDRSAPSRSRTPLAVQIVVHCLVAQMIPGLEADALMKTWVAEREEERYLLRKMGSYDKVMPLF